MRALLLRDLHFPATQCARFKYALVTELRFVVRLLWGRLGLWMIFFHAFPSSQFTNAPRAVRGFRFIVREWAGNKVSLPASPLCIPNFTIYVNLMLFGYMPIVNNKWYYR